MMKSTTMQMPVSAHAVESWLHMVLDHGHWDTASMKVHGGHLVLEYDDESHDDHVTAM